jgi:hypothetical protein
MAESDTNPSMDEDIDDIKDSFKCFRYCKKADLDPKYIVRWPRDLSTITPDMTYEKLMMMPRYMYNRYRKVVLSTLEFKILGGIQRDYNLGQDVMTNKYQPTEKTFETWASSSESETDDGPEFSVIKAEASNVINLFMDNMDSEYNEQIRGGILWNIRIKGLEGTLSQLDIEALANDHAIPYAEELEFDDQFILDSRQCIEEFYNVLDGMTLDELRDSVQVTKHEILEKLLHPLASDDEILKIHKLVSKAFNNLFAKLSKTPLVVARTHPAEPSSLPHHSHTN